MKVFVDTNVILDVLCDRKPFVMTSGKVIKLCEIHQIEGFISALSVPNIVYILRKELNWEKIREIVGYLRTIFTIADLQSDDLQAAVEQNFGDYEDALQAVCADRIKADYIITRNIRDFQNSSVPAVEPAELLANI